MQVFAETHTVWLGTDYLASFSNALSFSSTEWTNLASGTVLLLDSNLSTVASGTVVTSAASGTQTVQVELTEAILNQLGRGRHLLQVVVVLGAYRYGLVDLTLVVKRC